MFVNNNSAEVAIHFICYETLNGFDLISFLILDGVTNLLFNTKLHRCCLVMKPFIIAGYEDATPSARTQGKWHAQQFK